MRICSSCRSHNPAKRCRLNCRNDNPAGSRAPCKPSFRTTTSLFLLYPKSYWNQSLQFLKLRQSLWLSATCYGASSLDGPRACCANSLCPHMLAKRATWPCPHRKGVYYPRGPWRRSAGAAKWGRMCVSVAWFSFPLAMIFPANFWKVLTFTHIRTFPSPPLPIKLPIQ